MRSCLGDGSKIALVAEIVLMQGALNFSILRFELLKQVVKLVLIRLCLLQRNAGLKIRDVQLLYGAGLLLRVGNSGEVDLDVGVGVLDVAVHLQDLDGGLLAFLLQTVLGLHLLVLLHLAAEQVLQRLVELVPYYYLKIVTYFIIY